MYTMDAVLCIIGILKFIVCALLKLAFPMSINSLEYESDPDSSELDS
jgi:hypothetical protein